MHEQHLNKEADDLFIPGTLAHLVVGNEGRVLDGRRTPGYIEDYDAESAMFVWRITAFEDKGKCWEIPAEEIGSYQFRRECKTLSAEDVKSISKRCEVLKRPLQIKKNAEQREKTEARIAKKEEDALAWCKEHSRFVKSGKPLCLNNDVGESYLYEDLENYMTKCGVLDLEKMTVEQYLTNPYAGEWIKGMKIVMAEMGLIDYAGAGMRKPDAFLERGAKSIRAEYIVARVAFVRSVFKLCGYAEIPLYRGMASESEFFEYPSTLLSTTFSLKTAMSFADFDSTARSAYCVKYTCPVDLLFMTYIETRGFNERYKEQEAVIFYNKAIKF